MDLVQSFDIARSGASTKKSYKTGFSPLFHARHAPPPPALVRAYSEVMDVKTEATAASKALPPASRICRAASAVCFSPAAINPYFIMVNKLMAHFTQNKAVIIT